MESRRVVARRRSHAGGINPQQFAAVEGGQPQRAESHGQLGAEPELQLRDREAAKQPTAAGIDPVEDEGTPGTHTPPAPTASACPAASRLASGVTPVTRALVGSIRTSPGPTRAPSRVGDSTWSLSAHTAPAPTANATKPGPVGETANGATGKPISVRCALAASTRRTRLPGSSIAQTSPRSAARAAGQAGTGIRVVSASVRGSTRTRPAGRPCAGVWHDHSPSGATAQAATRTRLGRPVL